MHYNINERIKPKKHLPWKKMLLIIGILLIAVAVYVLAFHESGNTPEPPTKVNQPA